jgi:hypothetical protein
MEFRKVNEGGVRREDGVTIQIKHPEFLEYCDGDAVARVSVGYEPATRQITVYASEVDSWETSAGAAQMPQSRRDQLVTDLKEGLKLLKGNFVVI